MNIDIYGFLRSLSFGGLIGCGFIIILYILFPQIFVGPLSFKFMLVFGGLLGASAHRGIDSVIVKGILHPITRYIDYYGKLVQIEQLKRRKIIDQRTYQRMTKELTTQFFLEGKTELEDTKQLPPKSSNQP